MPLLWYLQYIAVVWAWILIWVQYCKQWFPSWYPTLAVHLTRISWPALSQSIRTFNTDCDTDIHTQQHACLYPFIWKPLQKWHSIHARSISRWINSSCINENIRIINFMDYAIAIKQQNANNQYKSYYLPVHTIYAKVSLDKNFAKPSYLCIENFRQCGKGRHIL